MTSFQAYAPGLISLIVQQALQQGRHTPGGFEAGDHKNADKSAPDGTRHADVAYEHMHDFMASHPMLKTNMHCR